MRKGLSVRVVPTWDGVNNTAFWRLDVLCGVSPSPSGNTAYDAHGVIQWSAVDESTW